MKRWHKQEEEFLSTNAKDMTAKEMANVLDRTPKAIRRFAQRNNISLSGKGPYFWTEEEERLLRKNASIKPTEEIALELGKSLQSVRGKAQKDGISLKKKPRFRTQRKYEVNHDFFSKIDEQKKAYWLGVLWADGNIHYRNGQYTVNIGVQKSDKEWLQDFKTDLNTNYPIKKKKGQDHVELHITSQSLFKDLEQYGIVPRKTYKNMKPPKLDDSLYLHFIRGIFDGDGTIVRGKRPNRPSFHLHVSITNSEKICYFISNFLERKNDIKGSVFPIKHSAVSFTWSLSGRLQIKTFGELIYENANRFLERKYQRFIDYNLLEEE